MPAHMALIGEAGIDLARPVALPERRLERQHAQLDLVGVRRQAVGQGEAPDEVVPAQPGGGHQVIQAHR